MARRAQTDQQRITGFDGTGEVGNRDLMAALSAPDI